MIVAANYGGKVAELISTSPTMHFVAFSFLLITIVIVINHHRHRHRHHNHRHSRRRRHNHLLVTYCRYTYWINILLKGRISALKPFSPHHCTSLTFQPLDLRRRASTLTPGEVRRIVTLLVKKVLGNNIRLFIGFLGRRIIRKKTNYRISWKISFIITFIYIYQ